MAFALVSGQHKNAVSTVSTASLSCTLTNNPTPGNLVCVGMQWFDGVHSAPASVSMSDGNSNAYTKTPNSPSTAQATDSGISYIFYLLSAPANAHKTITATFGTNAVNCTLWVMEFSNAGNCTFENDAAGTGTSGSPNTPTYTPGGAGRMLFSHATPGHSITSANGVWTCPETLPFSGGGDCAAYDLSASVATALNYTANTAGTWDSMIAGFYEASNDDQSWKPSLAPEKRRTWPNIAY